MGRIARIALLAAASSLLLASSSSGLTQTAASAPSADAEAALATIASPTQEQMMRLRDGLSAAEEGDWSGLQTLRDNTTDRLVRRMLEWRLAIAQDAPLDFQQRSDALNDLQGWPGRPAMRQRAEQAIFDSRLSSADRIAFLRQEGGPLSGDGRIALAQALKANGQRADAIDMARNAWREDALSEEARAVALAEFGGSLSQQDHSDRVEMLIWRGQYSEARGLFPRIAPADRLLAEARIALQTRQRRHLQRTVDAVPASRRDDPGLVYDRAQYVRRGGRPEDALLIAAHINPLEAPLVARPDIYAERRLYVPRALRNGDYQTAYRLVANHGLTSGEQFADAEWLAGWIALRYLHDAAQAANRFSHLAASVSAPVSRARALYWQAEAARAQGDSAGADAMLGQAAQYDFTYYGQLAKERLGPATISLPATAQISADARTRFNGRELVQALRLMSVVGDQHDFESIAFYLDDTLQDPQEIELLAQMARDRSFNRTALRSAKAGLFHGVIAANAAYPLLQLPPAVAQGTRPEPALVLGIIRQESEFDETAVSSANARGLMQLVPSTARITAVSQGIPYELSQLTSDPNYNITLGAAHLGALLDEYSGSYVLAIAAYNTGSHNVDQWIADWGDPRQASTDVVDWVELIPFAETRNYVQRVMENLQVYRHRLAGAPTPITIREDLRRGG